MSITFKLELGFVFLEEVTGGNLCYLRKYLNIVVHVMSGLWSHFFPPSC